MIGSLRFVLLIALFVWLGFWSVSPALASEAPLLPGMHLPPDALRPCLDDAPIPTASTSDPSFPRPYDCPYLDSPSPSDIPELLLPDLRTLPPSDLEIIILPDGSRELRLSNTIWNSGAGPLELEGASNLATQKTRVEQHIYSGRSAQFNRRVGEFIWHVTHDHFHFEDFSIYELWTVTPTGKLDRLVSASDKLSYCVIDTDIVEPEMGGFSPYKRYGGCGQDLQGLSVGWGDTYKSHLDGQSISITGIVDGFYALKSTVNPDALLLEANLYNNTGLIFFEIRGEHIEVIDIVEYFDQQCQDSGWWMVPGLICGY